MAPEGPLSLSSVDGIEVLTAPIRMQTVFVGNIATIKIGFGALVTPGDYLRSIWLEDDRCGGSSAELIDVPLLAPDPAEVVDSGQTVDSTRDSFVVSRDGVVVEEYVIAENVPLPPGTSTFTQRYIPLNGFEAGNWSFVVRVDEVTSDGVATLLATTEAVTIEIS